MWSHRGSGTNACVKSAGTAATWFQGRRASYDTGMHCPGLLTLFRYLPLVLPSVPADEHHRPGAHGLAWVTLISGSSGLCVQPKEVCKQ